MKLLPAFVVLLALTPVGGTFYAADDPKFAYAGRWQLNSEERVARADWPCSGVQFDVTTTAARRTILDRPPTEP